MLGNADKERRKEKASLIHTHRDERTGLLMCWSLRTLIVVALSISGSPTEPHAADSEFPQAIAPRVFEFPRDHANHPEYKTEWWYVTGVLETADGELFGYQATWFRSAMTPRKAVRPSNLGTRDLFFFHGALSDVNERKFHFDQAVSRGVSNWAGSRNDALDVFLFRNTLESRDDGSYHLRCRIKGRALDLVLSPERPALLHGKTPGLSQKGPRPGQASYYYSQTRMRTSGTIQLQGDGDGEVLEVKGHSWFDHEFGSNQLGEDQVGWDWFSVALDDGSDVMLYLLRKNDGAVEPTSAGTLRRGDGQRVHLDREEFSIEVLDHWTGPESGGRYPSRWRLRVPRFEIDLEARPLIDNQELHTAGTTGVTYWEGLCEFRGKHGSREVSGRGYVELVGYAGAFLRGI